MNDEALSRLIPSSKIGNDGFPWWIGQIEGVANLEKNNKGGYRYKVAIVGEHPKEKDLVESLKLTMGKRDDACQSTIRTGNIVGSVSTNTRLLGGWFLY